MGGQPATSPEMSGGKIIFKNIPPMPQRNLCCLEKNSIKDNQGLGPYQNQSANLSVCDTNRTEISITAEIRLVRNN